ncbi:helix-turn-helix domain-containing protein [Halobacteriovorax sp. GB3]|uniref:helix-turn-helix domain-containing protein n=1 Tax=Halobacteriovorax sp. GB3 TaxID=2719615 RepID=UPI002362C8FD|nr:helix-turn-helix domain-containing protein [Halobacteriovorax sp. GB3]MDD0853019.1 helix-turn-helix domain-containing protein [Halobacteriovorax sp. GB3]
MSTRNSRATNVALFKELVGKREYGESYLAIGTGLAPSTITRILHGGHVPGKQTRKLICLYFKVSEDQLFPLSTTQGEAA